MTATVPAGHKPRQTLTLATVAKLLRRQGLIDDAQLQLIFERGESQALQLRGHQQSYEKSHDSPQHGHQQKGPRNGIVVDELLQP